MRRYLNTDAVLPDEQPVPNPSYNGGSPMSRDARPPIYDPFHIAFTIGVYVQNPDGTIESLVKLTKGDFE